MANVGPVTGDVALYSEATDTSHIACDPANANNDLNGKIVLLSRGACAFAAKILNAQNAGAIAVIVMDNVPGEAPFIMGGDDPTITIPAVMISFEDGGRIRSVLSGGGTVNVTLPTLPLPMATLTMVLFATSTPTEFQTGLPVALQQSPAYLMLNKWAKAGAILFHY